MYAGHKATAINACDKIDEVIPESVLRSSPTAPVGLEIYTSTRAMVMVRFGLWDDILKVPFKEDQTLYVLDLVKWV